MDDAVTPSHSPWVHQTLGQYRTSRSNYAAGRRSSYATDIVSTQIQRRKRLLVAHTRVCQDRTSHRASVARYDKAYLSTGHQIGWGQRNVISSPCQYRIRRRAHTYASTGHHVGRG
eukprot:2728018-Rhodomonas_salina.1